MKIILAGFNVDTEILKKLVGKKSIDLTPETISAAYARISRSPLPVDRLRENARAEVEKARRSNETIIFEMGHHSIAEHAVFNFDIIGVSRLIVEEIEKFRLCSYTEKSQRYVKMQGDFIKPLELLRSPLLKEYLKVIKRQNEYYHHLYLILKRHILRDFRNLTPPQLRILENRAKEDARYVLPLATLTQLGATFNGRNLELMLRRFAAHPLMEVRELGKTLFQKINKVAPSIILFYQASDYERNIYRNRRELTGRAITKTDENFNEVKLISATPDGDDRIIAALIHSTGNRSYKEALGYVKKQKRDGKIKLLKETLRPMQLYDAVPREFEYASLNFELIVSATCFAQLKRHRIATITSQLYDPALGVTMPEIISGVGEQRKFKQIIDLTEDLYDKMTKKENRFLAQYLLTNGHRKRVLVSLNLRELYHMSRIREDATAQWDIREIVGRMVKEAKKVMPLSCFLMGGKDRYPEIYRSVFGQWPKVVKAELPGAKKF